MADKVIRRGCLVVVAVNGDFGKPRPALVVQTDLFAALPSVILCPLTSELRNDAEQFRIDIDPTPGNGLREPSQIMIDKIGAAPLTRIGKVIGQADEAVMLRVGRSLALMLGLA